MLKDECIIYFGPEKWDGMWRNRHQLMSRFSQNNKVLYVEPAIGLKQLHARSFSETAFKPGWSKLYSESLLRSINENLFVYQTPWYLPIIGRFPLSDLSWFMWISALKKTLYKLNFKTPIIWLSRPTMKKFLNATCLTNHELVRWDQMGNPFRQLAEIVRQKFVHIIVQECAIQVKENGADRNVHRCSCCLPGVFCCARS